MSTTAGAGSGAYEEHLRVPLRWWALLTMFMATVLLAFLVSTPLWVALAATGVLYGCIAALFVGYGAARVTVHDGVFRAGRARIPVSRLGVPVALDAEAGRRLAGVDADARAYLLLRAYVRSSVRVPVQDPADPTPYWMVSTRRPQRLVAALTAASRAAGWQDEDETEQRPEE